MHGFQAWCNFYHVAATALLMLLNTVGAVQGKQMSLEHFPQGVRATSKYITAAQLISLFPFTQYETSCVK